MINRRVLVIENSVDITGALKSIAGSAHYLATFFHFGFVIPINPKNRLWILSKGFSPIVELPMRELSKRFSALLFYLPYLAINATRLNQIVKKHEISLIHVNDIYNLLPVAIRLLGNTTPYVCHVRFLPDRFPVVLMWLWLKLHFRYAARIIAVSEQVRKQMPKHSKIIVIHDPLPVEERYPYNLANPSIIKNSTFLYLSNYIQGKGHQFALQAFARIHTTLPNWKLRFLGGDMGLEKNKKYRERLKVMAQELGIDQKIEWMEFTEEVEWELKQADIILNYSESESFSITCLEALYFGRPLIASDCGGPAEIIDHMETGILVPNRDVQAMADAMILLASNADLRNSMADRARVVVKERFSIENTSLKLKEVYNTILEGSTNGHRKDIGTAYL
jgi:glycosyltransferase involved in cell wall biosynthesis